MLEPVATGSATDESVAESATIANLAPLLDHIAAGLAEEYIRLMEATAAESDRIDR